MRKHFFSLVMSLVATFVVMRSPASATIIDVPGDAATIQGGINAGVNGDTVLIAPGTYLEHNVTFGGKRIIVASTNPFDSVTVASTVVDAQSLGRVFVFNSSETPASVLAGLTLRNGLGSGGSGGGVQCVYASPSIKWCAFVQNKAPYGGGVGFSNSNAKLDDCRFVANQCTGFSDDGGAAFVASSSNPVFTRCAFVLNESPYNGGAIALTGQTLNVVGCTFRDNSAMGVGGAIYSDLNRTVNVTGCVFDGNIAAADGLGDAAGAIYSWGTLTVSGSSFIGNSCGSYGGAINAPNNYSISECQFEGNTAPSGGGAIAAQGYSIGYVDCTWFVGNEGGNEGGAIRANEHVLVNVSNSGFVGNTANAGAACRGIDTSLFIFENVTFTENVGAFAGAAYSGGPGGASASFLNCILWADTPSELYYANPPTATYSDVQGGYSGVGNINADPKFTSYMGLSYVLNAGSPAIDAGDPTMSDQVYDSHPLWPPSVPNGQRADMGAYGGPNNGCMYQ